jgi:hypothetical protein
MNPSLTSELAATAARLVVEEGLEYGPAKRRALKLIGKTGARHVDLPDNNRLEDEVRDYLLLFCAQTQPLELAALRGLAAIWMARLTEFRPHLAGAAWRGTATRLSSLHIDLFCDDTKSAEIALINLGLDFDVSSQPRGSGGEPFDVLSFACRCAELNETVTIHLAVRDLDDLRGALKPDARGRTQRGDLSGLRRLIEQEALAAPQSGGLA